MDAEQIAYDLGVRIHGIVNDERLRNPTGDNISMDADVEIDEVQEAIMVAITAAILEDTDTL